MTATKLPVEGDNFAGQVFHTAFKNVTIADMIPDTSAASTAAAVIYGLFAIDQPYTWVKEIGTRITSTFGTSNTLIIGDTADADGFMKSAMIAPGTLQIAAGPQFKSSVSPTSTGLAGVIGAYANAGKLYTTTSVVIEAALQMDAVNLDTVGAFEVYAVYTVLPATWPS
jgi:hypothetical protein